MHFGRKQGLLFLILFLGTVTLTFAEIPDPVVEYLFNENGVLVFSTGSEKIPLEFKDEGGLSDLHSQGGLGVSGSLGDRAFDNTSSSGVAEMAAAERLNPALSAFTSSTWQGWFKFSKEPANSSRIFDKYGNNYQVYYAVGGSLLLNIMNNSVRSEKEYKKLNEWVFFAVTYDYTLNENNVSFYVGTKTEPVSLVSTHTLNVAMQNNSMNLKIGGWNMQTARFTGLLDNIRLFGSKSDSTGVLSLEQLEAIRIGDTLLIPDQSKCVIRANRTTATASLDENIEVTVKVVDAFETNLEGIVVSLENLTGEIVHDNLTATTDVNGIATFILNSLQPGKLNLEAKIFPGFGFTPITLFNDRIQIEFVL